MSLFAHKEVIPINILVSTIIKGNINEKTNL